MSNNVLGDAVLPVVLSNELAAVVSSGLELDVSVGGVPFNIKPTDQNPLLRQMVDDRKDQFDNAQLAGEQTFGFWWLRSQPAWHGGAGQAFSDTGTQDPAVSRVRYASGTGLYPFEPGELTVASAFDSTNPGAVTWVRAVGVERSAVQYAACLRSTSDDIDLYRASDMDHTTLSLGTGVAGVDMCTDGARLFVATDDSIIRFDHDSSSPVEIATVTFSGPIRMGWAKDRLIFTMGPDVHEVDPNGTSVALGTPHYTHPSETWRYTAIADGPNGIYMAGYAGSLSTLVLMDETESGGSLVLGQPVIQVTMPTGETLNDVFFYVNSLFVLGTSVGCRVGAFTPYGQPQFGPLTFEDEAVQAITAVGPEVLIGTDTGLVMLDLGTQVDSAGRYAYTGWTVRSGDSSSYVGLPVLDPGSGVQVFPVTGSFAYSINSDETQGSLTSSWYVFDTTEQKRVHYVTVSGEFGYAPVSGDAVTLVVENREGDTQSFGIAGGASALGSYEFGVTLDPSQAFRYTLTVQDDGGVNIVRSVQLKALPENRRFQLFSLPLMCFDFENPSSGAPEVGYPGFAIDRLVALEDLARTNATVTIVDPSLFRATYTAQVRDVQYRQTQGLELGSERGPLGGHITLIVALVT